MTLRCGQGAFADYYVLNAWQYICNYIFFYIYIIFFKIIYVPNRHYKYKEKKSLDFMFFLYI